MRWGRKPSARKKPQHFFSFLTEFGCAVGLRGAVGRGVAGAWWPQEERRLWCGWWGAWATVFHLLNYCCEQCALNGVVVQERDVAIPSKRIKYVSSVLSRHPKNPLKYCLEKAGRFRCLPYKRNETFVILFLLLPWY